MISTKLLEREIYACGWADLIFYNGSSSGNAAYSEAEKIELKNRKIVLEEQLKYINEINRMHLKSGNDDNQT